MNASYITSYKKNPQITQRKSNKSAVSIQNHPTVPRQTHNHQEKLPVSIGYYDALPYIKIEQLQKTKERHNEFFEKTKQNYIIDFTKLTSKYENPESLELGANILKLNNNYSKKILEYTKKNEITFIPSLKISTKDLQTSVEFTDKLFKTLARHNPNFTNEISCKNTSFQAKKEIIFPLTRDQKAEAHLIIHSASLMCAGISAAMGEKCLLGLDIPILVSTEMAMFKRLIDNFDAQTAPTILHATKYMLGAAQFGGRAIKWINGAFAAWLHAHVFAATGGIGNLGVSAYLRASNAAMSAALCEGMAWAFVDDYQQGKMTTSTKGKELIAFIAFSELTTLLNGAIQVPAETIQDKAAKALGETLANNIHTPSAEFVNEATKFLSNMPVKQAARGIEIITPVIAEHLIKNNGKISPDFLQDMLKGTVFSLVCGDVLGDISEGEVIKEKSKKLIGYMMHDETINKILQKNIAEKFAKYGGEIFLNKDTVKILDDIFKNVTPQITTIAKTMKGAI